MASLRALGIALTPEVVEREKWNAFWDAALTVPGAPNTWNSGVRLRPSTIQLPPLLPAASSATNGWPLRMAKEPRSCSPRSPVHEISSAPLDGSVDGTVDGSVDGSAFSPSCGLYSFRSQFRLWL